MLIWRAQYIVKQSEMETNKNGILLGNVTKPGKNNNLKWNKFIFCPKTNYFFHMFPAMLLQKNDLFWVVYPAPRKFGFWTSKSNTTKINLQCMCHIWSAKLRKVPLEMRSKVDQSGRNWIKIILQQIIENSTFKFKIRCADQRNNTQFKMWVIHMICYLGNKTLNFEVQVQKKNK